MTTAQQRSDEMLREPPACHMVPLECHITPTISLTTNGDYVCVLQLNGIAFECASDAALNNRHERLCRTFLGMANPHITFWQHETRDDDHSYPYGHYAPGFAHDLHDQYHSVLRAKKLRSTKIFLTIVYRPFTTALSKSWAYLTRLGNLHLVDAEQQQAITLMGEIISNLETDLADYGVRRLTSYVHKGIVFSEPAEFYGYLVNGTWERVGLANCPLNNLIVRSRILFGNETIEIRGPTHTSYAALLGIKGYPTPTSSIFLDELKAVDCNISVTQSFGYTANASALRSLSTKEATMKNAGDAGVSQVEQIPGVADSIVSHLFVLGEHHHSVLVRGASLAELTKNISMVRGILEEAGITTGREDLANEAAFWAQLPGNFQQRPRLSTVNNRNVCGLMSNHNYPRGGDKESKKTLGDSVATLITAAGTPYDFSYHVRDVGHTLVLGQTGSGKTSLLMFLLCMLQKFNMTSILFTVRRDAEITIRLLGGKFYLIKTGMMTGWNPFWLDPNELGTAPLLRQLLRKLVDSVPLTVKEESDLDGAIAQVLALKNKAHRRIGRVLDYLPKGINSVYERLHKWCYQRPNSDHPDGIYAWVFDNPVDTLIDNLGTVLTTGFDLTEFLDHPELRTPINLYLFYLSSRLIDGRPLYVGISEFWKPIKDKQFLAFVDDLLRTLRARNGFVVLDSQSPSDALTSSGSLSLIEQTPTKIFLPSPDAVKAHFMEGGMDVTERDFKLVKVEMPLNDGWFLLKRGTESVVLRLPLRNFPQLAALSARRNNIELMDRLIAKYGEAPHLWAPYFFAQRSES